MKSIVVLALLMCVYGAKKTETPSYKGYTALLSDDKGYVELTSTSEPASPRAVAMPAAAASSSLPFLAATITRIKVKQGDAAAATEETFSVHEKYGDFGRILTISYLSDFMAHLSHGETVKTATNDGTNVTWTARLVNFAAPAASGRDPTTIKVPRSDTAGTNGQYKLDTITQGLEGASIATFISTDASTKGVYVAVSPIFAGNGGKLYGAFGTTEFYKGLKGIWYQNKAQYTWNPNNNTDGATVGVFAGWIDYYTTIRNNGLLQSIVSSLDKCDTDTGSTCPMYLGGNSMGAMLSYFMAYDLATVRTGQGLDSLFWRVTAANRERRYARMIVIGPPRPGNAQLNTLIKRKWGLCDTTNAACDREWDTILRVVNYDDSVPGWPATAGGYVDPVGINIILPNKYSEAAPATMTRDEAASWYGCKSGENNRAWPKAATIKPCGAPTCDYSITWASALGGNLDTFMLKQHNNHDCMCDAIPEMVWLMKKINNLPAATCAAPLSASTFLSFQAGVYTVWEDYAKLVCRNSRCKNVKFETNANRTKLADNSHCAEFATAAAVDDSVLVPARQDDVLQKVEVTVEMSNRKSGTAVFLDLRSRRSKNLKP